MKKTILILIVITGVGCAKSITHNYTNSTNNKGKVTIIPDKNIPQSVIYVNDQAVVLGATVKKVVVQNIDTDTVIVKVASTYPNYISPGWNFSKEVSTNDGVYVVDVPSYNWVHYSNILGYAIIYNAVLYRSITVPLKLNK